MTDAEKSSDRRLELLARRERERQGRGHLPAERLTAYRAGELTPEEIEVVQDHLAVCRVCTAALLEIPRFEEEMEGPEAAPASEQTDAAWQALRARLRAAGSSPHGHKPPSLSAVPTIGAPLLTSPLSQPPPAQGGGKVASTFSKRITLALAAALAGCLIGFPAWIATHRGGPSPLVLTTAANSEVTRGTEDGAPLQVQAAAGLAVLVLPLPESAPFASYRIEIRTPAGDLRLTADTALTAVASPPGAGPSTPPRLLTLALSPDRLPEGEYRLRIIGLQDGHGETLAEHPLRIGG